MQRTQRGATLLRQPTASRTRYRDVAMLINHSRSPNLKLSRPLYVRDKWRIALLALREIQPGDEVTYDYGARNLEWLLKRRKKAEKRDLNHHRNTARGGDSWGEEDSWRWRI